MPVAGYNVIPDQNDLEPTIGVEYTDGNNTATIYIGDNEEVGLTIDELRELRSQISHVISNIKWTQASWVYAESSASQTAHLMKKGQHSPLAKTLCGRVEKFGWHLEPVEGSVGSMHLCKRCEAIHKKQQASA